MALRDLDFDIHYEGVDRHITEFVIPSLINSKTYCRSAGYFSVSSLASVAQGLDSMIGNGGKINMLIGLHLFEGELVDVHKDVKERPNPAGKDVLRRQFQKLLDEVGSLENVLALDALSTLISMIRAGIVEIKFANPLGGPASEIFHIKQFLFEDQEGDFVAASGSPNETFQGQKRNYESLTVFSSWGQGMEYAKRLRKNFWRNWKGGSADLEILTLGQDDIEELSKAVEARRKALKESQVFEGDFDQLVHDFRRLISAKIFSLGPVRLYPHQEATYLRALGRWPIRCILGDEVGLGKTIELGAILRYLLDTRVIKRVMVLAPKNVCLQFQEELSSGFDIQLQFWDSGKKAYLDSTGQYSGHGIRPGMAGSPNLTIVSSQLARGTKNTPSLLEEMDETPDLLVVDEAHAARVPPVDAKATPTLLYEKLSAVSEKIPHLILMTATPMQIELSEYHGLLKLIGLPPSWSKLSNFELALESQGLGSGQFSLSEANTLKNLLLEAESQLEHNLKELQDLVEYSTLNGPNKTSLHVRNNWETLKESFLTINPATNITIRSTKENLKNYGYTFPEREFTEVSMVFPKEIIAIRKHLNEYLTSAYGEFEKELSEKGKKKNVAFVRSVYEQRFASSLAALHQTLSRRHQKLENYLTENTQSLGEFSDEDFETEEDELAAVEQEDVKQNLREQVKAAIAFEKGYLVPLIRNLESFRVVDFAFRDPKLEKASKSLTSALGSGRTPLIFSRYRDTISSFLEVLRKQGILETTPYGVYTGKDCWVSIEGKSRDRTKAQIQTDLKDGSIEFLLCSDAASEGLNLQTADTLINLDVPWNPARLEQRIGRIARLGQKADFVQVQNVWYSNSVEATMYQRLLSRKELYDFAVGRFPDIISTKIRSKLSDLGLEADGYSEEIVTEIEEMRKKLEKYGLDRIWNNSHFGESYSQMTWDDLDTLAKEIDQSKTEGDVLSKLATKTFSISNPNATLYTQTNHNGVWRFGLKRDGSDGIQYLQPGAIPRLMLSMLRDETFQTPPEFEKDWTPNHQFYSSVERENYGYPEPNILEQKEILRLRMI